MVRVDWTDFGGMQGLPATAPVRFPTQADPARRVVRKLQSNNGCFIAFCPQLPTQKWSEKKLDSFSGDFKCSAASGYAALGSGFRL